MSDGSQERYFHGTRADLRPEDLIEPGDNPNFGSRKEANHVYLTATVDAAVCEQNWQSAKAPSGSTSWNQLAPSRMTRT